MTLKTLFISYYYHFFWRKRPHCVWVCEYNYQSNFRILLFKQTTHVLRYKEHWIFFLIKDSSQPTPSQMFPRTKGTTAAKILSTLRQHLASTCVIVYYSSSAVFSHWTEHVCKADCDWLITVNAVFSIYNVELTKWREHAIQK